MTRPARHARLPAQEDPRLRWDAVIPQRVRYDNTLPAMARLLYGELIGLMKQRKCTISNRELAARFNVGQRHVQKWLERLKIAGHIDVIITRYPARDPRYGTRREITLPGAAPGKMLPLQSAERAPAPPPAPPRCGAPAKPAPAPYTGSIDAETRKVMAFVSWHLGVELKHPGNIPSRIRAGASAYDCMMAFSYAMTFFASSNLNTHSPFSEKNFQSLLDQGNRAWFDARESWRATNPGRQLSAALGYTADGRRDLVLAHFADHGTPPPDDQLPMGNRGRPYHRAWAAFNAGG